MVIKAISLLSFVYIHMQIYKYEFMYVCMYVDDA